MVSGTQLCPTAADEIRSIRERFGLTQAELARLLRLGDYTISRWEAGRNVQAAAMDMLLRMIRDLPGSLRQSLFSVRNKLPRSHTIRWESDACYHYRGDAGFL